MTVETPDLRPLIRRHMPSGYMKAKAKQFSITRQQLRRILSGISMNPHVYDEVLRELQERMEERARTLNRLGELEKQLQW